MTVSNLSILSITAMGDGAVAELYFEFDAGVNPALNPHLEISLVPGYEQRKIVTLGVSEPTSLVLPNMPIPAFGDDAGFLILPTGDRVFYLDALYYWRVSYDIVNDEYVYVDGPPIDTHNVVPALPWGPNDIAEYPFMLTVSTPEQSTGEYGVLFGWLGIAGDAWSLEYSGLADFSDAIVVDVSGMDYYPSPFVFQPDTTYYWRIRYNGTDYDGNPFYVPFGTAPEVIDDTLPYAPPEGDAFPVNEPDDLQNVPAANIGNKLRAAAQYVQDARQRLRDWAGT